jgi:cytochrome c peroxidase
VKAWAASAVALAIGFATVPDSRAVTRWSLATSCPASFELRDGFCRLRTPYQDYRSLTGAGVGGLKTGLPPFRDRFTPAQIDLGRYLFFDPALSATGKLACATCHRPANGFAEPRARSVGATGQEVRRNAPSLWNAGFLQKLFWDGRARTLEEQAQGPLYGELEMGTTPRRLEATLNGIPVYRDLFAQAFPGTRGVLASQVYTALAAFESSLVSLNSRYDLYAHGVPEALSAREIEGLNVFRSFVARCAECHTPPLFTNQQVAVIGMPEPGGHSLDPGAGAVTGIAALRGGFRIPSLRNVALTAPYGHAGQFSNLRETVAFYTGGRGHAVPKGEKLQLHWHIWEPHLSAAELDRLVDFLQTLTDESFRPASPTAVPSGLPPAT